MANEWFSKRGFLKFVDFKPILSKSWISIVSVALWFEFFFLFFRTLYVDQAKSVTPLLLSKRYVFCELYLNGPPPPSFRQRASNSWDRLTYNELPLWNLPPALSHPKLLEIVKKEDLRPSELENLWSQWVFAQKPDENKINSLCKVKTTGTL